MSTDDLKNIIANIIRMIGNASYSSSLSTLSGMSPSSWLMESTCCNHMTSHLFLFSELKPASHPLNIRTTNGFTMSTNVLKNVIANVIRMVSNASYSSSLSVLFGMSPTTWLTDSAC